uniref:ZMYM2-like/QRICH1 C-terminal domain-containing protein n=1 Tax=Gopherus agassizii TaxID=38772 RepID=A0A452ICF5_9SAUR
MEDCLHTSSENLSKLVSWAHSHGTICSLIPNLKHLLSEGSHGNLTAMWGCSAGHAYHWPLTATCRAGSQERVCFQDNRSFNSDSPSIIGVPSETQTSPVERYPGRSVKAKLDCNRTRDSCDFSYCSEPSELDEAVEEYEDEATLFDMVCESSVTDEDSDFEPHTQRSQTISRKRPGMGQSSSSLSGSQSQVIDESSNNMIVKKIKQEIPEDYYIVANAELTGGIDGPALSLTQMSKPKPQTHAGPSYIGPSKPSPPVAPSLSAELDLQNVSASPPVISRPAVQKPARITLASPNRGPASTPTANQQVALQMPVSTSNTSKQISIPLSALQLPGQEEQAASEDLVQPVPNQVPASEVALSPSISAEPEVSSSQQQPNTAPIITAEATAQSIPDQDERAAELSREQNEKTIRSTQTALRNFREFLISKYPSETREIYVIPCKELDAYLASFFVDARQKDGSEYEPNSLANYQCGLERYLKEHRYGYSITRDKEFKRSQEALKQKQIELRCKGKGNKPHKSMKLTFADELILRKRGLLSRYNPEGLLNLVWLNNTKAFGHCTGFHGSTLKWGDIRLRVTETGLEYLEWMGQETGDLNAKTKRGGTDSRVYATQHAPQTCPVQDYKEYAQRRPPAMRYEDAPFYLSIKPVVNLAALHWYNCQALGKNKLAKMVKTMCEKGNIPGRKTNFSVYQSCSTLSEAQSNQLVLICNNLSQQAAQSMASHSSSGNFIVSASYDSSSDTA